MRKRIPNKLAFSRVNPYMDTPFPVLKTPRLILRQMTASDSLALFKLRSNEDAMKYISKPLQTDIVETMKRSVKIDEMNLHSIETQIEALNTGSEKLLLKFNFKKEAYFTENYFYNIVFLDTAVYSLIRS